MKRILLFLCFLPWLLSASSQELPDSAKLMAEMEDSISGMSIVPIKHPKELLDSIVEQVVLDLQQKRVRCKYQVMQTSGLHTSRPTTSSCIIHAVANIQIHATGEGEEFRFDGPRRLRNLRDTTYAYYDLKDLLAECYMLRLVQTDSERTVIQGLKYLISLHHIKVYSISDEKGRDMAIVAQNLTVRHISTRTSIFNKLKQTKSCPPPMTLRADRIRMPSSPTLPANTIGWISMKSTAHLLSNRLNPLFQ